MQTVLRTTELHERRARHAGALQSVGHLPLIPLEDEFSVAERRLTLQAIIDALILILLVLYDFDPC